ncbi:MAG: glycosyltransferase [Candidatus Rokubacteria bacterium]|nr:glycosyltransferase [Candidatus Rokubacteria bacterium]
MISVVVPFFNERESVLELHDRIVRVLARLGEPFEIIFVDDGSTDETFAAIRRLPGVRGFQLKRSCGQTAAFALSDSRDVVVGWRRGRWRQQLLRRRLPSAVANRIISWMTGVRLHDHGCNLRVYRREVFDGIPFLGEMHRMLAAYLGAHGARVFEVPVQYQERRYGHSKYGLSRIGKVILDVIAFYFFDRFASRPIHFFGSVGIAGLVLGAAAFLWAIVLRVVSGIHFNRTPLPVLVAIFVVVGVQCILMGLVAEIIVRMKYEKPKGRPYEVRAVSEGPQ